MNAANKASPVELLLCTKETAKLLNVSESWVAKSRLTGTGPSFVKVGRSVKYPMSAIQDYLRARTRSSTSERGA